MMSKRSIWSTTTTRDNARSIAFSADGHYRATPVNWERDLRYVVQTDAGEQLTLTPAEFSEKYGWKNDRERVRLTRE